VDNCWYLCIRCNFKNYSNEIKHFCDWIYPYLSKFPGDFLGFTRYEETEMPTLIYYAKDGIKWVYPEVQDNWEEYNT
jgi:hypothetical protein